MAIFDEAYNITLKFEGGYSNDKDDAGGETYKGIARKYHPTWSGWEVIDRAKKLPNFPKRLEEDLNFVLMIKEFYKNHYWNRFLGDDISYQEIANEVFDTAVNMGVTRSCKFLQESMNFLNRDEFLFPDLVVDGLVGRKTLNALNSKLPQKDIKHLYKILNLLQGNHYLEYMRKSPIQEKFARGWLSRVEIRKR